jgi:integrase
MTPRQQLQLQNHPTTNSIISVEPIRTLEDVARVKAILSDRNLVMFTLGVNINLRAGDLLALTMGSVDFQRGEIVLREKKTGKKRHIALSMPVMMMLVDYCKPDRVYDINELLFPSHKGGGMIGVSALNHMVKKWCEDVGLKGNFGSHTLRKTWAFLQYTVFGTDLSIISDQLNHSSMKTTYRYLGIMPDHIRAVYANFI